MDELKDSKNNGKEKEIIEEEKPLDTLKDNIKKENISEINEKNQSIHNNNENDEINILINNNNDLKKEEKINNINKNKEEIIKKANKVPELKPYFESQFNESIRKIKNKSLEKKMKDLFNSDKKNEKENNKEINFIDKLKQIEEKIVAINEYSKNKKNALKTQEENNRYKSLEKNDENNKNDIGKKSCFIFDYDTKLPKDKKDIKYKGFKQTYFSYDNFYFYNSPSNKNDKKIKINNYMEEMKRIYKKYNYERILRNNNHLLNPDNFKKIIFQMDKFKQSQDKDNNKFKPISLFKNNSISNDMKVNEYRNKHTNFGNFKSLSIEKPSKVKDMIDNIYFDINKTSRHQNQSAFDKKLSNMKTRIKYSNIAYKKNSIEAIKSNNIMGKNRFTKPNFSNMDDLLKLCSKRSLKKYIYNQNMK